MVVPKLKSSDVADLNTKQRILEVAIHLFAVKGVDGASIREIAKLADVNVASVNYYFQSKENLRQEVMDFIVNEFRAAIKSIPKQRNISEYALRLFETITADSDKCLNQFKLILDSDHHPCSVNDPYPFYFEEFASYLSEELKPSVTQEERMWLTHVVFSYIVHIAVMSSTSMGKEMVTRFFPKKRDSIPHYISQLVESLIRDLNQRY